MEASNAMSTQPTATPSTLRVNGIFKSYSNNPVLRGIDMDVAPGEVIALAGENGAGKSTLLKIMAGLVVADEGEVSLPGHGPISSVNQARDSGVTIVPQELAPVPDMAVYENIFLGREITKGWRGLDRRRMANEATELMEEFGLRLDPRRSVGALNTASQQLIEIIKSVSTGARFILLDEPTSALAPQEVEQLYATVRRLREQGVGMVFTTHKMEEIRALADRVVVLRDGKLIVNRATSDITDSKIVEAMIGRELKDLFPSKPPRQHEGINLKLSNVALRGSAAPISFDVRAGEIVALAGLMGAGRTSLLETVFGIHRASEGRIELPWAGVDIASIGDAIRAGVALVPEDRKVSGGVLSMSILNNSILPNLKEFSTGGRVRRRYSNDVVSGLMESLHLRYSRLDQDLGTLSGGNQQKVVLGKWLSRDVRTLLLDEPTRGVDVGARSEIYKLIMSMAREKGIAILFASSDMMEVIGLADRVLVMRDHMVVKELITAHFESPKDLQEEIFLYASGLETVLDGKAA